MNCNNSNLEIENNEHFFGKCTSLNHLYEKYDIIGQNDVFDVLTSIDRLRIIARFIKETKIEKEI